MNKYKFKLLTSTGLGHEYFYCYGDEHFEQWLKRKNIKYEIDKKFGQMSVDSICHLFPNEMIIIRDYITNLQEENERFKEERQNINNRNYNQKIANRKLMEDIEKLRTNLKTNKRRRKKQTHKKNIYKSRNEKAIKCIKERYDYILKGDFLDHDEQVDKRQITYLLNILKGDNK